MIRNKALVVLALFCAFAGFAAPAQVVAVRSGKTLTCHLGTDCSEETINGRHYFVMQTAQMMVKVSIEPLAKYNHISVAVENRASHGLEVAPEDFRIEATQPKFKRLSYIEPAKLKLPKVKAVKEPWFEPVGFVGSSFMGSSSKSAQAGPKFLTAGTLAPDATTSGEVYFERSGSSYTLSLLLPIAGSIFEFPYQQK